MNKNIKRPCRGEPYHSSTTIKDGRKTDVIITNNQVGY